MKKIVSVLLMMTVLLSLSACGSSNSKLVGSGRDNPSINSSIPDNSYTFYEDGTGTTGTEENFKWTLSGDKLEIQFVKTEEKRTCTIKFAGSDSFSCLYPASDGWQEYNWEMYR